MTPDTNDINRASSAAAAFIVGSLLFIVLIVAVKFSVHVPTIDADRAVVRASALYQIHTNEVALLNNPGWIDQSRGIVRLPIDTAMQETLQAWQDPAQARADLIARQQNAAKPAPAAPAKPSAFE